MEEHQDKATVEVMIVSHIRYSRKITLAFINHFAFLLIAVPLLANLGCVESSSVEPKTGTDETSEDSAIIADLETSSHNTAEVAATQKQVDVLLNLIGRRLQLMHEVARWKWNKQRSIEAPEREQQLLSRLVEKGKSRELEAEFVQQFFRAQMEAAKMIQRADFENWTEHKQGRFENVRDLKTDLRDEITELSEQLLDILAEIQNEHRLELVGDLLQKSKKTFYKDHAVSRDVIHMALSSLAK